MEIVDSVKFAIGILFAIVGAVLLVSGRGSGGFGQRKQAGILFLVGAIVFILLGLGKLDF